MLQNGSDHNGPTATFSGYCALCHVFFTCIGRKMRVAYQYHPKLTTYNTHTVTKGHRKI
uniref:Uncharacterized protein n=1 Tax=Arundo donax TaxID=35708 RepID=A0A0A8ZU96_ARUDO